MKSKIKSSLIIAIVCLVVGITIIVINYTLDNTRGNGYSNTMSTANEYHRSLAMVISSIILSAASVGMMIMSLITFMRRKQEEDEELLRRLDEEQARAEDEAAGKE
jgi:TRAP-type C4-dicarboxylate transport system permease small subunit